MKKTSSVLHRARLICFLTIALMINLSSCNQGFSEDSESLKSYLDQEHALVIEEALYIVIPINSCDACRQIVYRNLLTTSHSKEIRIVFSGKVREALTNQFLGRLDIMGVGLIYDPEEKAVGYDLIEEEYPMGLISFMDVIGGEVVSKTVLRPDMVNGEVDIRKEMFKNYIK